MKSHQLYQKRLPVDIMNGIRKEIMLFLKDLHFEPNLICDKKYNFSYLHLLALRVVYGSAISDLAERISLKSGLLMAPHRSRLSMDTLSKVTFVQCNLNLLK